MAKRCALSTGNMPRGCLPRNSVDSLTYHPDMTSVVYSGRKASTQLFQLTIAISSKSASLSISFTILPLLSYRGLNVSSSSSYMAS